MAAAPDPSQAAPAVTASRKLEQVIQNKHKKPSRKLIKKEVILFYNSWPEPASFACILHPGLCPDERTPA